MKPVLSFAAKRLVRAAFVILVIMFASATTVAAQNWTRVTGIDTTRGVYSVATSGGVFFAASEALIYRSVDGLSWNATGSQPVTGMAYYVLTANDSVLFAGTDGLGVHRSLNGGLTWTPLGIGLPQETVIDLALLGDSLYAGLGFSGVYVLNLASPGVWMPYTTGLTQFGANSLSVAGDRLYAGLGYGFFVRARGAPQWTEIDLGAQRQVYRVAVRPEAGNGALYAATSSGVYKAPAADSAWRPADIGPMAGRAISSLTFHGERLYAGLNYRFEHWIWSTDDGAVTWDVRAHEFTEVWGLRVHGDRLFALRNDGLWWFPLAPVSIRPERRPAAAFSREVSGRGWRPDGRRAGARDPSSGSRRFAPLIVREARD